MIRICWKAVSSCCWQSLPAVQTSMLGHQLRWYCDGTTTHKKIKQLRRKKALEWLGNLSPEMEREKAVLDEFIQRFSEQGIFTDYEIQPEDIHHLLTEATTFHARRKFIQFKQKSKYLSELEALKKEESKRLKEEKLKHPFDPEKTCVYTYTVPNKMRSLVWKKYTSMRTQSLDPIPVVVDLDYKDLTTREQIRASEQISHIVNVNRNFPEPCAIHLTSYKENVAVAEKVQIESLNKFIYVHEESFIDLFPKEKLVYLSPDGPALREHTPGDIYVIGGVVDLTKHEPISLRKAKKLGIRCGSLPFVKYGIRAYEVAPTGFDMILSDVMKFVLQINLNQNWDIVMKQFKQEKKLDSRPMKPKMKNNYSRKEKREGWFV